MGAGAAGGARARRWALLPCVPHPPGGRPLGGVSHAVVGAATHQVVSERARAVPGDEGMGEASAGPAGCFGWRVAPDGGKAYCPTWRGEGLPTTPTGAGARLWTAAPSRLVREIPIPSEPRDALVAGPSAL